MTTLDLNNLSAVEAALQRFVTDRIGSHVQVRNFRRCSVGFSWLTLAFDLVPASEEGALFILQIGPATGLFAPYSSRPQLLALEAVRGSGVPIPHAWWHSDDVDVFGAPFFVSQRLPGEPLVPWSIKNAPAAQAAGLLRQFVEILGRLHAVNWHGSSIAKTAEGIDEHTAAARQIDFWAERITLWSERRFPMLARAERWLREHAPVAPRVAIVHGDYRIGNFLQENGTITGILDWELAHLGDPHEDVAWACLPMFNGGSRDLFGLLPRAQVFADYEAISGFRVDPSSVRFWEVFAFYKSVAINLGGARCFEDGRYHDVRMAAMGTQVAPTLKQLYRTMEAPL